MKNKQQYILYDKNIARGLLILSIPVILSNILKSIHDLVDMYFVAKINMPMEMVDAQTGAISVTSTIIMLFQALAMGLMIAGGALMSQYIGQKRYDKAKRISGQLLLGCIIAGVLCNILLFCFAPLIMRLMNAEGLIFDYSVLYLRYRSFELIGLFVFYAYQATRQAKGDTLSPVILNSIAIILNIILTAVFIKILGMDIRGAAIGTIIANMIIVVPCVYKLFRSEEKELDLELSDLKFDWHNMKKLIVIGLPAALSQALTSVGFMIVNSFSMRFDNYIITGIGASHRINSLLFYPTMSIGGVLATYVGQNIGANNIERARRSVKSAIIITLVMSVIGMGILIPLRENILVLLLNDTSLSIEIGAEYLLYLILNLPFMGVYQILLNTFQGAGKTNYSLVVSSLRLWALRIPFIVLYLDVLNLSYLSIAYSMVISNIGACILCYFYYLKVDFKPQVNKLLKKVKEIG